MSSNRTTTDIPIQSLSLEKGKDIKTDTASQSHLFPGGRTDAVPGAADAAVSSAAIWAFNSSNSLGTVHRDSLVLTLW